MRISFGWVEVFGSSTVVPLSRYEDVNHGGIRAARVG